MEHEMRAEYAEGVLPHEDTPVRKWHMTRVGATVAMCGQPLAPAAATQSAGKWGTAEAQPFCRTCGVMYLEEHPQDTD
ncbi:hypothetical protein K2224_12415 [Streptomyces sp. BHT-5-2]|uniref:hypothetical protein n=1 Tax=unclassified Streptomyces TaxID=2593676 RepID=UPI001C8D1FC7|nr:hypothetical protein [Streptomyces sp. BHT-5-2]QZL03902.1 hypothetical protein K2224_12415 [Streptomyces sp. BHT-5-2]